MIKTILVAFTLTVMLVGHQNVFCEGDVPERPSSTKTANCPFGKYFMDKCANACFCDSDDRKTTCTRIACNAKEDVTCPYGKVYYHDKSATCFCNEEYFQTYECFLY